MIGTAKAFIFSFRIGDLLKNTDILGRKNGSKKEDNKDRRKEERYRVFEDCRVAGDMFSSPNFSKAMNISRNGIRIKFSGIPLRAESSLKIDIKNIDLSTLARTVWSRKINDVESEAGLEFGSPLPDNIFESVRKIKKA